MTEATTAARRRKDKRRIRGEESRRAILEAAIDCIARRGLRGTTLDAVADRAKVSRALVGFHFKSKNRLLIDVLEYLGRRFASGWEAILAAEHGSVSERLLRLLAFDVRFAREYPHYISVWHAFWGESNGSTLYREVSSPRDRRYMADVQALLAAIAEEEGRDEIDVSALVCGIEAMLFGFWLEAHLDPAPERCEVAMRALRQYLHAVFPNRFAALEGGRPS